MNYRLYAKVKNSARYYRNIEVRKKINWFLEGIKTENISLVCKRFGIHRSSYYRWWKRFEDSGFDVQSLEEKSRAPIQSPNKKSDYVVGVVKKYRIYYHYGPKRILGWIKRNHRFDISEATIARLIKREGWILKKYKTKKKNKHTKRYNLPWPGYMQMDIKYVPERINDEQYYVYNIIDDCTRWRFALAYKEKTALNAVYFVRELIKNAPFKIKRIQTDNDLAFTNRLHPEFFDKKHIFTETLREFGIRHRCIPPGEKELNGKVERSHRTDDEEFFWKTPLYSFGLLEQYLGQWIYEYNFDRPHSSIGDLTPMEKWTERFLVAYFTCALHLGIDIWTKKTDRRTSTWSADVENYSKYLAWIDSDPFHVADVRNYYSNTPSIQAIFF